MPETVNGFIERVTYHNPENDPTGERPVKGTELFRPFLPPVRPLSANPAACYTRNSPYRKHRAGEGERVMGVDFSVRRIKRKGVPKNEGPLPEIDAHFAVTEYPRFLSKLAEDAGLGALWSKYRKEGDRLGNLVIERARSHFEEEEAAARQKPGRRKEPPSIESDPEFQDIKRTIEAIEKEIGQRAAQEPLVEFLVAPMDGTLSPRTCGKIAPRLRSIAHEWTTAPEGFVGWREKALELAEAMQVVSESDDLVFAISG